MYLQTPCSFNNLCALFLFFTYFRVYSFVIHSLFPPVNASRTLSLCPASCQENSAMSCALEVPGSLWRNLSPPHPTETQVSCSTWKQWEACYKAGRAGLSAFLPAHGKVFQLYRFRVFSMLSHTPERFIITGPSGGLADVWKCPAGACCWVCSAAEETDRPSGTVLTQTLAWPACG